MSVADQSVPLANLSRRVPFTIRFSPQFVNRMCDRLQKSTPARTNVTGLLFGRSELDLSEVQVFRSFPETADNNHAPSSETDELAALVEDLLAAARNDPEIAALQLLGWYAFRPTGGLHESDVAFHNRYFRQPNEVALILRPEQHPNVLFEIYSRSGTTLLSEDEHRWGSLRLPTDTLAAGPVDVAMRTKIGDDFYLRAYQVSQNLDRAERREHWANAVQAAKSTVASILRPKRKLPAARKHSPFPAAPPTPPALLARAAAAGAAEMPAATHAMHSATSLAPALLQTGPHHAVQPSPPARNAAASLQKIHAGDPPALPAVIKPPKRGIPWFSSIVVAAVAAGGTIAFINHWNFFNGAQAPAFLRAIFPDTGLGLRVEGQGDRVLLSWNRHNAVVSSSKGGVLHIDDGPLHRDVQLDAAQIANGAVLYRPGSDDVSFRLEVHGQQGAAVTETMRVLDGAKAPSTQAKNAPPDVSPSTTTPPSPAGVVPTPQPRSRPDTPVTPPLKTRSTSAPAAAPAEAPLRAALARADPPRTSEENRSVSPSETVPPPAVLGPTSFQPAHTEGSQPNPGTPATLSEARSPSTSQQLSTDTPKPAVPSALPDTTRPLDALKVPNSEEAPARKLTDSASPSAAPPAAPARPLADTRSTPLFVPPKPLKQVLPDLRNFGPNAIGATAEVEVAVRVNKKGRVTQAYLVGDSSKVPPHLARAALGAAKLWIFQPATLRGKEIPSDHTVVFEFHPAGH